MTNELHHSMYEMFQPYPDDSEWAVKWHAGEHGPKGWPSHANPLSASDTTPAGYQRYTGRELNAARAAIIKSGEHIRYVEQWNAKVLADAMAETKRALDEQQAALEAIRTGAAHKHIDGAKNVSELRERLSKLHEA